jgi:hypothetical protein
MMGRVNVVGRFCDPGANGDCLGEGSLCLAGIGGEPQSRPRLPTTALHEGHDSAPNIDDDGGRWRRKR